jgi:hypothetical protein
VFDHRLLEIVTAAEREPAVGLVRAYRGAGCLDRFGRRRHVGVEILQPENVRVFTGRRGDPVDVKADDVIQALGACCEGVHADSVDSAQADGIVVLPRG